MRLLAITFSNRIHHISWIDKLFKCIILEDNLLKLLVLLLLANIQTWAYEFSCFSKLYHCRFTQIYAYGRPTTSTNLWASLRCSSKFFDIFAIGTGDKFSSLPKLSAAMTSWFLNCLNWLISATRSVRFWTSRDPSLSLCLQTLSFTSN